MFGFNNKVNKEREAKKEQNLIKARMNSYERLRKWLNSEEHKRFNHLQTLIIKAYETVGIKAERYEQGFGNLIECYTREDYLEDFKVFFKPEVFDKLKEWCKEYEFLRDKENKVFN